MVSAAINGDLGSRIGTRVIDKERKNEAHPEGYIALYHDGFLIDSVKFRTKSERKSIMDKWKSRYQLQNKTNIYFQISYL